MTDWKIVALTSCLSLLSSVIVAVITSIVTAKVTQRNDDRKMIQEKRVILYWYKISIAPEADMKPRRLCLFLL